jgi:hypothetical protein
MTTKDTNPPKTVTDNPAADDKEAAKLIFIIPLSYTSFIVVAIGWFYLCLGSVREFLASYCLLDAVFVSYLAGLFVCFGVLLNQYEVRLGKSVKCEQPLSGLIAVLAIAFASFVHYETFYFGQDSVSLWYFYLVVMPVGFFWWILIVVCMTMIAPCGFFINEAAVRKFLSEHPLANLDQSGQVGGEAFKVPPPHPVMASYANDSYYNEDSILPSSSPPTELHDSDYPSIVIDHKAEHEPDRDLTPEILFDEPRPKEAEDTDLQAHVREATARLRKYRKQYYHGEANVLESTSNVDTYTLEAALFGGLAFSSVVSIVSSEKYDSGTFADFIRSAGSAASRSAVLDFSGWKSFVSADSDWLISVLLSLSIFSAAFFLASLFCRIPFSRAHRECKLAFDRVGRKLAGMRNRARRSGARSRSRGVIRGTRTVERMLEEAKLCHEAIDNILNIMRVFRIAGLVAISLILVAVCARVNLNLCWMVVMLIAIGFSNMLGAPMAKLMTLLRSGRARRFALRRRPRPIS